MKMWLVGLAGLMGLFVSEAEGATINVPDCTSGSVSAAVSAAQAGDTVQIPPGTCTWTSTIAISAGITLQGAGIDATVIVDEGPASSLISLTTTAGKRYRVTGLTFVGGTADRGINGLIWIGGTSKAWRVDNVKFDRVRAHAIRVDGDTYGVVDHSQFTLRVGKYAFTLNHSAWGGAQYGDGSWADASSLGTERAIFIEDSAFSSDVPGQNRVVIDAYNGARYVFRHNVVTDGNLSGHGTESSGRQRGTRQFEIYENVMSNGSFVRAVFMRSGTGVIWGNNLTGYATLAELTNYRSFDSFLFGRCDGTSVWDRNMDGGYASGFHTGEAAAFLSDVGSNWVTNQWVGYSLHNLVTGRASVIQSNDIISIRPKISVFATPQAMTFNSGDAYEIRRAYPCLDQVGWVGGVLLSGYPASPTGWPTQALEPVYEWDNTLNGTNANISSNVAHIQEGREFYNDVERPGYIPFTYPHPLVQENGSIPPTAPTSLTVR